MSSVSSATSGNVAYYASQRNLFSKLDSDADGKLTQDEFVAGRPKSVTESQATKLYSSMDAAGSGSLSEDEFDSASSQGTYPRATLESLLSGDAMAVLMLMSQQGGMQMGSGMMGQGDPSSLADLYSGMDADGDGSVTQAEFVSARPSDVSEDDAQAFYATIDTDATGSITEDEFAAAMKAGPPGAGGPPSGGAGGAGGAVSSDETYDALDTNEDGMVSEAEFLASHPEGVTDEQASALFDSIDTEGTGSITREQFATFMNGSRPQADAGTGAGLAKGISELLALLGTNASNAAAEDTDLLTV